MMRRVNMRSFTRSSVLTTSISRNIGKLLGKQFVRSTGNLAMFQATSVAPLSTIQLNLETSQQARRRDRRDKVIIFSAIAMSCAFGLNVTLSQESKSKIYKSCKFAVSEAIKSLTKKKPTFQSEKVMNKRYDLGKVIGEGTFASVRVAKDKKNGEEVAIKAVNKKLSDEQALENEVAILKATGRHENIISLIDVYDAPEFLYIVTDFADGGELFDRIIQEGELSEQAASKMMREAMLATKHLHDRSIIHLDIKPENLLLAHKEADEMIIKLADFGLAIKLPGPEYQYVRTECVGTPAYWAPELVKNEAFGNAVDIWALGCVLYILLCGSHPFDPYGDAPESEILAQVVRGNYDIDSTQYIQISPQAKDLISHMLDPNPERRYTAAEVLSHPWMNDSEQILSAKPLPFSHITKLKAFRALQLMRMGLNVHAGDDVEGCVKMFSSFDQNHDGVLSRAELSDALRKIGVSFNTKEMDELFLLFDVDDDGQINEEDFKQALMKAEAGFDFNSVKKAHEGSTASSQAAGSSIIANMVRRPKNKLQHVKYLFDTLDKNHDGYIDKEDCIHLMDSLGYLDNRSKLYNRIQSYKSQTGNRRKNSDKIDFTEFVRYFRELETNEGTEKLGVHINRRQTALRRVTAKTRSGNKTKVYIPGKIEAKDEKEFSAAL